MSQPVLLKVYGNFSPADSALAEKMAACGPFAPAMTTEEEVIRLENGLLLISFEGTWFPVPEVVETIRQWLPGVVNPQGKLDVLDLEEWTLCRYLVQNGELIRKRSPLNNVLDYSGH